MGQNGIPISIAIIISSAIIGAVLLVGLIFLAVFPS
jgi:hypothetical protein